MAAVEVEFGNGAVLEAVQALEGAAVAQSDLAQWQATQRRKATEADAVLQERFPATKPTRAFNSALAEPPPVAIK